MDVVLDLSLRAWAPVFVSLEQAFLPGVFRAFYCEGWRESQRKAVRTVLQDPEQRVWVADGDAGPVGFVAVRLHPEDAMGEIYMVAVDPDHQRNGIGTKLTERALAHMREAGMRIAMVETGGDPGHAPARLTYERAGFTVFPVARYFKDLSPTTTGDGG